MESTAADEEAMIRMRLQRLHIEARHTSGVVTRSGRLQMVRIHALPITTEVIDDVMTSNWAMNEFIGIAMRWTGAAAEGTEDSVTRLAMESAGPDPARISKPDLLPEARFLDRFVGQNACFGLSGGHLVRAPLRPREPHLLRDVESGLNGHRVG